MGSNGKVFEGSADLSNSFETTNQKHVDFDEDKSDIPMVVCSPHKQEEEPAKDTTFSDCEDDCESFFPTDPMSFAWQIARGMVWYSKS